MTLQLFDTYSRKIRKFEPLSDLQVGMYTCGPTVYDYAHIGNLRTYIFEDILRRALEFNGYIVKHVMNITDVGHLTSDADTGEDRMEKGSKRTGKSAWEIADIYTKEFKKDMNELNIKEPRVWCRATDHIQDQIEFIKKIEEKGYTYRTLDGIYFDTSNIADYGHIARLNTEGLKAGARVEIAEKRNVTDFALWKFSPENENRQMEWDSPWGVGFPGWHIECSAMSAKYLGPFFDIHCGGEDHIMVHHPNEIAQTQACHGTRLANFWMHGYFLQIDESRMGKSVGNFIRLQTLRDRGYDPLVWRFFCLNAHYRSKLNFTWENMDGSSVALNRLRKAVYEYGQPGSVDETYMNRFAEAVNNDLNMPQALAITWDLIKSQAAPSIKKATVLAFDEILGLGLADWKPEKETIPRDIMAIVEQRNTARKEKRWEDADKLREKIHSAGYELEDTPEGTTVKVIKR
jgi:cysteinyl-tRNA synthetase